MRGYRSQENQEYQPRRPLRIVRSWVWVGCGWVVTGRGDVLHQGADQGLPAGLAKCLGGLVIREEAIGKILFMAQNSVQSGNKKYMARLKADSLTSHCSDAYSISLVPTSYSVSQSLTVPPPEPHPPRIELQEALAVLCYVPAPCLRPNCIEETSTSAELLPEQWPECGLGAQHLHTPNPGVDTALQHTQTCHLRHLPPQTKLYTLDSQEFPGTH